MYYIYPDQVYCGPLVSEPLRLKLVSPGVVHTDLGWNLTIVSTDDWRLHRRAEPLDERSTDVLSVTNLSLDIDTDKLEVTMSSYETASTVQETDFPVTKSKTASTFDNWRLHRQAEPLGDSDEVTIDLLSMTSLGTGKLEETKSSVTKHETASSVQEITKPKTASTFHVTKLPKPETPSAVIVTKPFTSRATNLAVTKSNLTAKLPVTKSHTSSTPQETTAEQQKHGYVLINQFPSFAQQAVGFRVFLSPQCLLGSFNLPMYIVEPFIQNSIVHTHAQPRKKSTVLSLSDFYDLDHYNEQSKRQGMAEVTTWRDFVDNAPREIVFLDMGFWPRNCTCLMDGERPRIPPRILWRSTRSQKCKRVNSEPLWTLTTLFGFCVVKMVAIHPTPYICSEKEMQEVIFGVGLKPNSVTLIFERWCASMYIPNTSLPDPKICKHACSVGLDEKFLPSKQLISHIQAYESKNKFDRGRSGVKLAVMLRTEHVVIPLNAEQRQVGPKLCLAKTTQLVHSLQSKLGVKQPYITVDIGTFGSNGWRDLLQPGEEFIINEINTTLLGFFNHSLTLEEWENSFTDVTGGIKDRGYIAALQKGIASRADCIVFLGGGNFVRMALHEYLNLHPEVSSWCIYFVCIEGKFKAEYDVSLDRRSGHKAKPQWELLPENKELGLYVGSLHDRSVDNTEQ